MLTECFHFNHDPLGCSKLKLAYWNIGNKCDNCTSFLFINWDAIDLPREVMDKLYQRLHEELK